MARYGLFVLKVPLNPNQPTNLQPPVSYGQTLRSVVFVHQCHFLSRVSVLCMLIAMLFYHFCPAVRLSHCRTDVSK